MNSAPTPHIAADEPSAESLAEMPEIDFSKVRIIRRGRRPEHAHGVRMRLASARVARGLTQDDVATRASMAQSEVSKIESRADHKVSTLRRYVEALGGKLEVVAVFEGDRRVILDDV